MLFHMDTFINVVLFLDISKCLNITWYNIRCGNSNVMILQVNMCFSITNHCNTLRFTISCVPIKLWIKMKVFSLKGSSEYVSLVRVLIFIRFWYSIINNHLQFFRQVFGCGKIQMLDWFVTRPLIVEFVNKTCTVKCWS